MDLKKNLLKPIVLLKRIIFAAALIPAAALDRRRASRATSPPIRSTTSPTRPATGRIRFLVITLAVTPLRRITGWNPIIQLRRMLGLFSFFYATLHFLTWFVLDWFFDVRQMADDIVMRPFITLGMATFLMLLALAVPRRTASIRRLGRKWTQLHRLIYRRRRSRRCCISGWRENRACCSSKWLLGVAVTSLLGFRVWWAVRTRARTLVPPPR